MNDFSLLDVVPLIIASAVSLAFGSVGIFLVQLFQRTSKTTPYFNDDAANDATTAILEELAKEDSPTNVTSTAQVEALAILKVYGTDLMREAARIAGRAGAEQASAVHVRQAANRIGILRDRTGLGTDIVFGFGALLAGAAISFQINVWTGGTAAEGIGVWMAVTLAAGIGLMVGPAVLKWRRI